jgi:archaellum component FlaF (FlaF/FlaG flagellin family)
MINGNGMMVRQGRDRQRGQALVWVGVCIVAILFLGAIIVDLGAVYAAYQQLQASTQAAALAGASLLPTTATSSITTTVETYGVGPASTDLNYKPNLNNSKFPAPAMTVTYPACLTASWAPPCYQPTGDSATVNAIKVTQTATVGTMFARLFGVNSLTLSSTAEALAQGGTLGTFKPYNVMMVLDTTESMGTNDSSCGNVTQEACAQGGIRTLLLGLGPCSTTYNSSNNCPSPNTNPLDQVALMVFPGLTPATNPATALSDPPVQAPTASDDYICPTSNPSITSYNNNPGYLITPFLADYQAYDNSGVLKTSSDIVIAAGGAGGSCKGVGNPGGEGTFYAGAITAAQAFLTANHRADVQDIMILLSDGDAESCGLIPSGTYKGQLPNGNATGTPNITCTKNQMAGTVDVAGTSSPYSIVNECYQAVTAANTAKTTKQKDGLATIIYSVSYGSESSGGCPYDQSSNNIGNSNYTPCSTMSAIASTPTSTYFFSNQPSGSGTTICPGARSNASLNTIFNMIAGDLKAARLVPGTTF